MAGEIRVGVNGYGVIGKRVADAVRAQADMRLVGVSDVAADWRTRALHRKDIPLFAATSEAHEHLAANRIPVEGRLQDLLGTVDVVVDCTPKRVAAENVPVYRQLGRKFIVQGGEKHGVTGHSFVAESTIKAQSASTRPASSPAIRWRRCGP